MSPIAYYPTDAGRNNPFVKAKSGTIFASEGVDVTVDDIRKAVEVARHHDNLEKTYVQWAKEAAGREKMTQDTLVELQSLSDAAYTHNRIAAGIRISIRAALHQNGFSGLV